MKETAVIILVVMLVIGLFGGIIWYWNSDPGPYPGQITLPLELEEKTLLNLRDGEEVQTHWTTMKVDSRGYCWIQLDSSISENSSFAVTKKGDGFSVKIKNKDLHWSRRFSGSLRNAQIAPVLEIVQSDQ